MYKTNPHSKNLINFLKEWEGYNKISKPCPAGHKTIGYGHNIQSWESDYYKKLVSTRRGITVTEATTLLNIDLDRIQNQLTFYIKSLNLKPYQKDALMSLIFNWGAANFAKSKLLQALKNNAHKAAAHEFLDITKANGKILTGLVNRRKEESYIFLNGWEKYNNILLERKLQL